MGHDVTDQLPRSTVFHLFERETLRYLGAFQGERTANTDGIAVRSQPLGPYREGALWAVHDDRVLTAFDWKHIEAAVLK